MFEKTLVAQRCHWHRCATNFIYYLRQFEAIFVYQGPRGSCLMKKKTRGRKSRVRVPSMNFLLPAFGARTFPSLITTSKVQNYNFKKFTGVYCIMNWLSIALHVSYWRAVWVLIGIIWKYSASCLKNALIYVVPFQPNLLHKEQKYS
jgi:hypothetical protein